MFHQPYYILLTLLLQNQISVIPKLVPVPLNWSFTTEL